MRITGCLRTSEILARLEDEKRIPEKVLQSYQGEDDSLDSRIIAELIDLHFRITTILLDDEIEEHFQSELLEIQQKISSLEKVVNYCRWGMFENKKDEIRDVILQFDSGSDWWPSDDQPEPPPLHATFRSSREAGREKIYKGNKYGYLKAKISKLRRETSAKKVKPFLR